MTLRLGSTYKNFMRLCAITLTATSLSACSYYNTDNRFFEGNVEIYDPMEESNRLTMAFNQKVDDYVIYPIIDGYRYVTPKPAQTGVTNFLRNLGTPIVFINQALQGDVDGAGNALVRFSVNTLIGLGGLIDVAASEGIEYESEDFGQTLAMWGVGYGPYVVAPLIGPSSVRDYAGYFTDAVIDPTRIYLDNHNKDDLSYIKTGVSYMELRNSLKDTMVEMEKSSIDYYAAIRSIYYQNRERSILDGKVPQNTATSSSYNSYDDFE